MSSNDFLFNQLKGLNELTNDISSLSLENFYLENLNPDFNIRNYQEEAFKYFKYYFEKVNKNNSLLFNMATGSGKTLIMAGLILYLFSKGHNKFLFFVNSTNVINKTKDNFLNKLSDKYLFSDKIIINNQNVTVKSVDTFEGVSEKDINICFTTIQKLHSDLNNMKENSLTFDDFKNKEIVLIADEAHHIQASTKSEKEEEQTWEDTISKLLDANTNNLLLEFTATVGIENNNKIKEKYLDKLLYKYDLKQYVYDKYSKNIEIFTIDDKKENLMLTAILINQYRQDIASKYSINNFKPVILFKTNTTIAESEKNRLIFEDLIDNLSDAQLSYIKNNNKNQIIKKVFDFYESEGFSLQKIVKKIKVNYKKEVVLDVNKNEDLENYQLLLNNLESKENIIRVIFAVQKLNEGWDVLNLFDIVRLSNKKGNPKKPSKTTISEAQLIGRGARYYPFVINNSNLNNETNKFKRKFDDDLKNELRILEELYFYSFDDSAYISELHNALVKEGLAEDMFVKKELKVKNSFKSSKLYNYGVIYTNKLIKSPNYFRGNSLNDLQEKDLIFRFNITSGKSSKNDVFDINENDLISNKKSKTIKLGDIESHIIKNALSKNRFYEFNNLKKYFNNLNSINDFISNDKYLNSLSLTFIGNSDDIIDIPNQIKFEGILSLLSDLENLIKKNSKKYRGSSDFNSKFIRDVFYDKLLILKKDSTRLENNGDIEYLYDKDWYVFNANYGTSEERKLVKFIDNIMDKLNNKYEDIFLIRNELHFYIYNFEDGNAFAPDFVLFLKDKENNLLNLQIFIEPKGEHLIEHDKWKENLLNDISIKKKLIKLDETEEYLIYGLPFYNSNYELEFKKNFLKLIN